MAISSDDVLDVVIIGAGLSGVDAAYRLRADDPSLRYLILERRERVGGTWDLFRYPGVRSDSDIFTLSFPFEPWQRPEALAAGGDIRDYIAATADRHGITDHIRFGHHVQCAQWDSATDTWTVTGTVGTAPVEIRCRFLYFATGYYDYDHPYRPQFPGEDDFHGPIVHPQHWPTDLDVDGKKVVVIGSGATTISLIPALTRVAAHVTMLQRSPSYIASMSQTQRANPVLRKLLPHKLSHQLIRTRYAVQTAALVHGLHRFPRLGAKLLLAGVRRELPDDYPVDEHFTPDYAPWDQRMCMVPDGDLFAEISSGQVDVVTDHIDRFDETGIVTASGRHLDADVIVTATGLQLLGFGGVAITVDGAEVGAHDRFLFKSHLLEGVPNLAWAVGYTNASWTLRADMTARAVARLRRHMRRHGYSRAYPRATEPMDTRPLWDLRAGYVLRSPEALPKAGTHGPRRVRHNYFRDLIAHHRDDVAASMEFHPAADREPTV